MPAVFEPEFSEALSFIAANPALVVLATAIAVASAAYAVCIISERRMNAHFSLGRLETFELERAVVLHGKVLARLQEIRDEAHRAKGSLLARHKHRKQVRQKFAAELTDLEAYAAHLRATIVRLRLLPIQRFKSWMHLDSACFALSRSLALCLLVVAMLTAYSSLVDEPGLLGQYAFASESLDAVAGWLPAAHDRMLNAGWVASILLAGLVPALYLHRLMKLRIDHRRQFRALKKFAAGHPNGLVHDAPPIAADMPDEPAAPGTEVPDESPSPGGLEERPWFSVLGLSPSASVDEIKQAYKAQIMQNHPDRLHAMSPLLRELAEAETKKLNAAYEEALRSLQPVQCGPDER